MISTEQVDAVMTVGQVDFFSNNGSIQRESVKPLADVLAVEYNPVRRQLYVSDDSHKNYSIFTLNLLGDSELVPLIKSKYSTFYNQLFSKPIQRLIVSIY